MQTFLTHPDFAESAAVLDDKRLGKQRVETLQIMTALLEGRGWINHPATKMWYGYEYALLKYQEAVCYEWAALRGFRDTCLESTMRLYFKHYDSGNALVPWWLGGWEFHQAHQSNLVRKDPLYYRPQFPDVPDDLPYIWPV